MMELNTELYNIVGDLTEGYKDSHDRKHAQCVVHNVNTISEMMSMSNDTKLTKLNKKVEIKKVLISAAWLHDVLDHKIVKNPEEYGNKQELMRSFLLQHFQPKDVSLIFDIIANVSFSKEKRGEKADLGEYEILRDIVSDGDKLEAIGRTGVLRCYQYTTETHPHWDRDMVIKEMKTHCEEKLMLLYTHYIRTDAGKELGKSKHQDVLDFYNGTLQLESVLEGA